MEAQQTTRPVSPEAEDLLSRLRDHYRNQGKAPAASNYTRHLRKFFSWAEALGYGLQTLPAEAVETYLESLTDQKETSKYVIRTQIKSALREAHNSLGVDFAHLQYESGKPKAVRQHQKAKEKEKRAEKRLEKAAAVLQLPFVPTVVPSPSHTEIEPEQEYDHMAAEATPTSPPTTPPPTGVSGQGNQQPIVVMVPQQSANNQNNQQKQNQKPLATIGGGNQTRGVTINNHTFTGAFIKLSRIADGSDAFVPMGTETYVTTLMASQLAPHGDVAGYLQQYVLPKLRLAPNTSQVPFVFHELNDRKQPTGRRDELVVSVPLAFGPESNGVPAFNGMAQGYAQPPPQFDRATEFMLKRLEDESNASKARNEKLDEELRQAKDSQTQFILMQQMAREQDLRRELEQQKMQALAQANQPPPMLPAPVIMPEPPRLDPAIELAKVNAESSSRLLEAVLVKAMTPPPQPAPPPPQKDMMEWFLPFMAQMNQQNQQMQQQANQMMVQMMQSQAQFLQSMATRESPELKLLREELKEVRANANAPKADDVEDFADKLQKFKMVGEMLGGGGGGGGPGLLDSLLANADTIGEGISKVLAARSGTAPVTQQPVQAVQQPALPAPQLAAPPPQPTAIPSGATPPADVKALLDSAADKALKGDEQNAIVDVMNLVQKMMSAPAPFPAYAERIVNALNTVEDEDDLYAMCKHLWVFMAQKPNKPAAKAMAVAIAKWFPLVHENLFGEKRYLVGQSEEEFGKLMEAGNAPSIPEPASEDEEDLDNELDSDDEDESDEDSDDEGDE